MTRYVAQPFVAGSPDAMVIGQTVLAFSQNLHKEVVAPLLPKYGLDNIDPEAWYPHQSWMNVLREVSEGPDSTTTLVALGRMVVETAAMPPEINSIPQMLELLHTIHHMNLRNVPADEGYRIVEMGDKHYYVYHNTPNPDDAIYGFLWGLAARFKGRNEQFVVRHLENPDPENEPGTLFEVKWGPKHSKL